MNRRVGLLAVGCLALWAVVFFPARYQGGEAGVVYSLVAAVVCLLPTSATLIWASHRPARSAQDELFLVVGGTGLRLVFVLGTCLALYLGFPYFQQASFWVWVLVFYLFTLALEMVLLRNAGQAAE